MNEQTNSDLLSNIISLINSSEYPSTITNMADSLKVSKATLRNAILAMLQNQVLESCLYMKNAGDNTDENTSFNLLWENPKKYYANLLEGLYDNEYWKIDLKILDPVKKELLPLSQLEYSVIKTMGENVFHLNRSSIFEKKDFVTPIPEEILRNKEIIQRAIRNNQAITFHYCKTDAKTGKKTLETKTVFPTNVITNLSDNWVYMQAKAGDDDRIYRLDRIAQTCQIIQSSVPNPKHSPNPNQKYVWGVFMPKDEEPFHVKLKLPSSVSVRKRVEQDTLSRTESGREIYKSSTDHKYYYEDNIIGTEEFKRWLRSFGPSVVVLEPEWLRNDMINYAKDTLDLYKKSLSWGAL